MTLNRTIFSGLVFLMGCYKNSDNFAQKAAELECDYMKECSPELFELSCQRCTADDECPSGLCNRVFGECNDENGNALGKEDLGNSCETTDDCVGLVCRVVWNDLDTCVDTTAEQLRESADKCEYEASAAAECIRSLKHLECDETLDDSCSQVYYDCVI